MQKMKIVIDTNIFCRDFYMSNSVFRVFFDGLKRVGHVVYIPQVIYDEVLNKYNERLLDLRLDVETSVGKFSRFVKQEFDQTITDTIIQDLNEEYKRLFDDKLKEIHAHILDYPQISHQKVVQRALERRKPFNEKGAGYRDTLIWESILELISIEPIGTIALISANTKDFAEQDELHEDLLNDIQLLGNEDNSQVIFFSSIESFIDKYIKPTMEILEGIQTQLAEDTYPDLSLQSFISDELISLLGDTELDIELQGIYHLFENPSLSQIEEVNDIFDIEVRQLSSGHLLVSFSVTVLAQLDFFISKANFPILTEEEQNLIWEHDWNDHYMAGSINKEMILELNLTFDTHSQLVTSADIVDISPVSRYEFSIKEMNELLAKIRHEQAQKTANISDSISRLASQAQQPFKEFMDDMNRRRTEQFRQLLSSRLKFMKPQLRMNDEIKEMIRDINRRQTEQMTDFMKSMLSSNEIMKGLFELPSTQMTGGDNEEDDDVSPHNKSQDDTSQNDDSTTQAS